MAAKSNVATKGAPLIVERTFDAPVAVVWKALTDKEDIRQWSFDVREFKPEVGFEFQFYGEGEGAKYSHHCRVTEAIPNKRLAYTWRYEGYAGNSLVTFDLFAEGNKTTVRLTHDGLETFPRLPAFARANFLEGWTQLVGTSLKTFVEVKHDTREMSLTRVFDAPRELVFIAWTDPAHLVRWWGPHGFTLTGCEMDFRPGGEYRFVMRGPDGNDNPFHGVYREIVRNERIVFSAILDNLPGQELLTTVTFADEEGRRTKLTVRQTTPAGDAGRGQSQGWGETLERLADLIGEATKHAAASKRAELVGDREIAASRIFDAPRELVWKVWTEPEHIANWWGPKGFTTTTYNMDVKPGGVWRFVMHGPDRDYQNKITYVEVVRPERLVYKHGGTGDNEDREVEPVNFQVTVIFTEQGSKTRLDMRMVFLSPKARDYVIQTYGALEGLNETLGRLEEYLAAA